MLQELRLMHPSHVKLIIRKNIIQVSWTCSTTINGFAMVIFLNTCLEVIYHKEMREKSLQSTKTLLKFSHS